MTPQDIKEQVIRMEGFSEGLKNGTNIFAQWLMQQMEKEQTKQTETKDL